MCEFATNCYEKHREWGCQITSVTEYYNISVMFLLFHFLMNSFKTTKIKNILRFYTARVLYYL